VKGKTIITILATGMFLFTLWLGALGFSCVRGGYSESQKILTLEKKRTLGAMKAPLVSFNQSELVKECKSQPVLLGMLMLFIAVSAAGVGFACHLIRGNDHQIH